MKKNEKIWSILVHLSMHMWEKQYDTLPFDDSVWEYILKESEKEKVGVRSKIEPC